MPLIERRKGQDRRQTVRYAVQIDVEWESPTGVRPARISDVSETGCFLLTSGEVDDGQIVKLFFKLDDGQRSLLWGKIVNHVFEVGFAVKFVGLSDETTARLQNLVAGLSSKEQN